MFLAQSGLAQVARVTTRLNVDTSAPLRLTAALVGVVQVMALILLWLGSHLPWWGTLLAGCAWSFVLLTNYALMHEGAHDNLDRNASYNRWLGTLAAWLFPMSFTFLKVAHQVHHRANRTDYEMFDLYNPGDNRLVKFAQWYSILIGIYWPIIPIGSALMAYCPAFFQWRPLQQARSSSILFAFGDFDRSVIHRIRTEVSLGILYWLAIFWILDLKLAAVLTMYACFAVNWSTRQYVTHAFTQRDVMYGALNLKVGWVMRWVLLNSHWDAVHHLHPRAAWHTLPQYAARTQAPISYWRQYARLWRGPKLNTEAAPPPLSQSP